MTISELLDRVVAAWNAHDPDAIAADFADQSAYWSPTVLDEGGPGAATARADAKMLFTAFPDFLLTEKGRVITAQTGIIRWETTGTFTGPLDPPGFAPTNAAIRNHGVTWVEVSGGRIVRFHLYYDLNELGRQIGALPPPGSAGEKMVVSLQRLAAKGQRKRDRSS